MLVTCLSKIRLSKKKKKRKRERNLSRLKKNPENRPRKKMRRQKRMQKRRVKKQRRRKKSLLRRRSRNLNQLLNPSNLMILLTEEKSGVCLKSRDLLVDSASKKMFKLLKKRLKR
jgi:hypothetical protein